ncbi:MAG: type VI secretion system ATPase TssH [Puniceicoccales bacterium]
MAEIKRSKLFGKLNTVCYQAAESAAVFCKMRGNPYIELVHWVHQLLQKDNSDIVLLTRHFELDPSKLSSDVIAALDRLPRGATSISDFSSHMLDAVERGWVYASLLYSAKSVRSSHLILGMLKTDNLAGILFSISGEFKKIDKDKLSEALPKIVESSIEEETAAAEGTTDVEPGQASEAMSGPMGKGEALKKFTVNLTQEARDGNLDPVIGRDPEIRQLIDILMRRRQNNPILVGEAGVGKTAVVEGFALRIADGDVPPAFQNVNVHALDLGGLQAGASMKGEFENRLKQLIEEVQASTEPIILFIDEAHTLIGAGGAAGQGDAANLLKPALARGTLRTIAATTYKEYKKYIEKDPALTRRFQTVAVDEPNDETCVRMLRGLAEKLGKHHKIEILDEALEAAVSLSRRYIPDRQLPDKAVSLLDTACARVAVSQSTHAAALEDAERLISFLEIERGILEREKEIGKEHTKRLKEIDEKLTEAKQRQTDISARWAKEKELVDALIKARGTSSTEAGANGDSPEGASEEETVTSPADLRVLDQQLELEQGESPMVFADLNAQIVASVVADWTGIPAGRMVRDEIAAVLKLADTLENRVVGQRHALDLISQRIQTNKAGLEGHNKPIGVFLLAGPSGVGKTETALALAETLYGGERNLITINMSEFQEAHTVSTLKGSPPGYVGYGEGGVLSEAVRRKPYSVVLLDEVEKAHPDVHEIFFQVFDKGVLQDGEGRMIDFKNTIILLTSNVGSDLIMKLCEDPELKPEPEALAETLRDPLLQTFPAALLGRLSVIPYFPLTDDVLSMIIRLQFKKVVDRVRENHDCELVIEDAAVELVLARCTEVESGGRMVEAIILNQLLPRISREILSQMLEDKIPARIIVSAADDAFTYEFEAAEQEALLEPVGAE